MATMIHPLSPAQHAAWAVYYSDLAEHAASDARSVHWSCLCEACDEDCPPARVAQADGEDAAAYADECDRRASAHAREAGDVADRMMDQPILLDVFRGELCRIYPGETDWALRYTARSLHGVLADAKRRAVGFLQPKDESVPGFPPKSRPVRRRSKAFLKRKERRLRRIRPTLPTQDGLATLPCKRLDALLFSYVMRLRPYAFSRTAS